MPSGSGCVNKIERSNMKNNSKELSSIRSEALFEGLATGFLAPWLLMLGHFHRPLEAQPATMEDHWKAVGGYLRSSMDDYGKKIGH
jgi:hypothetical protein